MIDLRRQFEFAYAGESTKRFHTARTIGQNTVGEHSFTMVWLLWLLTGGSASAKLLMAAVAHDLAEQTAGDMPAPFKRRAHLGQELEAFEQRLTAESGWYFSITAREERQLKMADILSGLLFCVTERSLGNLTIWRAYTNFYDYAMELEPVGPELQLLNFIDEEWRSYNEG